jgi:hypothetical protein
MKSTKNLLGLRIDAVLEELGPLDSKGERLGDVEPEGVSGVVVEGGGEAKCGLLAVQRIWHVVRLSMVILRPKEPATESALGDGGARASR